MVTKIIIEGHSTTIEEMQDGYFMSDLARVNIIPNYAEEVFGKSVDEVVGRLRAKGYNVVTTPPDDGLIGFWEIIGQSAGGDSRWFELSEREACEALKHLPEKNPQLGAWTIRSRRLTPEQFKIRNGGNFHVKWIS